MLVSFSKLQNLVPVIILLFYCHSFLIQFNAIYSLPISWTVLSTSLLIVPRANLIHITISGYLCNFLPALRRRIRVDSLDILLGSFGSMCSPLQIRHVRKEVSMGDHGYIHGGMVAPTRRRLRSLGTFGSFARCHFDGPAPVDDRRAIYCVWHCK